MTIVIVRGMDTMSVVGERVLRLRERMGWSQSELAERSGLDASYISLLETGRRPNPGLETLVKLARALKTSISYLVGETDDPRPIMKDGQAAHDREGDNELTPEDIRDLERAFLEIERRRRERRAKLEEEGS